MNSQSLPPYWDAPSIPTCPLRCLESFDSDEAMVNVDLFLDALRGEMLGQQGGFQLGAVTRKHGFSTAIIHNPERDPKKNGEMFSFSFNM